eukprot:g5014.t1
MSAQNTHPSVYWQTAVFEPNVIGVQHPIRSRYYDAASGGRIGSWTRPSSGRYSFARRPRTTSQNSDNKSKKPKVPWDMHSLKAAVREAEVGTGQVANAIRSSTFRPREQAFTKLISVCGRWRQVKKALEVFEAMLDCHGVRPNTITYTALIAACNAAGDCKSAVEVFYKMKTAAKTDPNCRPNEVTYSKIITASDNAGYHGFAVSCFCEMEDYGIPVDQLTYCATLHSCLQTQLWKKAIEILSNMHEKGLAANVEDYYAMITYYGEKAEWEEALTLFLTMQKLGQSVDEYCCHALMRAFELAGISDMAMELLNSMWEENIFVQIETYLSAISAFTYHGKWEEVLKVVGRMINTFDAIPQETKRQILTAAQDSADKNVINKLELLFQGCRVGKEF